MYVPGDIGRKQSGLGADAGCDKVARKQLLLRDVPEPNVDTLEQMARAGSADITGVHRYRSGKEAEHSRLKNPDRISSVARSRNEREGTSLLLRCRRKW